MATTTSVSGSDSLTGTDGSDKLVGGAGSDTLNGGEGSDFINAGGGNDWIIYDQDDYKILGGGGIDTLWFTGSKQNLNFGTQAINGIEALWLYGDGGHTVSFSAADIVRVSDNDRMTILGGQSSTVTFADTGWSWDGLVNGQNQFSNNGATVIVDRTVNVDGFSYNATFSFVGASRLSVEEDKRPDELFAAGQIKVIDPNQGQAMLLPSMVTTFFFNPSDPLSSRLTIDNPDAFGNYKYTYYVKNSTTQSLGAGDERHESFLVETVDGTLLELKFTIIGANDAPELTGTPASLINGAENKNYTISVEDLLLGFTDKDVGDTLTVADISATNGTISATPVDGKYTFTPAANYTGGVTVNYNVVDGNGGSTSSALSFSLKAPNNLPTGKPFITGTPQEGEKLTAMTYLIADADGLGPFSHQWERKTDGGDWAAISGANDPRYVPDDDDVGQSLRVKISYTDLKGNDEVLYTGEIKSIVNVNDFPTIASISSTSNSLTFTASDVDSDLLKISIGSTTLLDLSVENGSQTIYSVVPQAVVLSGQLYVQDNFDPLAKTKAGLYVSVATDGNDSIEGTLGKDLIYGFAGNDAITGNGAADTIYGGDGDDKFLINADIASGDYYGGPGSDTYEIGYPRLMNSGTIHDFDFSSPDAGGDIMKLQKSSLTEAQMNDIQLVFQEGNSYKLVVAGYQMFTILGVNLDVADLTDDNFKWY